jgi:hypothetical protein
MLVKLQCSVKKILSTRFSTAQRQVDRSVYCKWFTEELFSLEYNRMLELFRLESKLVLARFSSQIAMKMVSLAMEEDNEVARQACMDVINHPDFKDSIADAKPDKEEDPCPLLPELASKWLAELANYQESGNEPKQADSLLH